MPGAEDGDDADELFGDFEDLEAGVSLSHYALSCELTTLESAMICSASLSSTCEVRDSTSSVQYLLIQCHVCTPKVIMGETVAELRITFVESL